MKAAFQHAGTLFLAVLMLLFGAIYGRGGYLLIGEWLAISRALAACAVLFVVCGAVMVACGLWLLLKNRARFSSAMDWRGGHRTVRIRYPRGRSVECDSLRRSELIPASYGLRWRPSSRRGAGVGQRARLKCEAGVGCAT